MFYMIFGLVSYELGSLEKINRSDKTYLPVKNDNAASFGDSPQVWKSNWISFLETPFFCFMGKISYPVYLFHFVLAGINSKKLLLTGVEGTLFYYGGSIALGYLLHVFIEKRLFRWTRSINAKIDYLFNGGSATHHEPFIGKENNNQSFVPGVMVLNP